ncbi:NADH-quinone oxidoreductase subunit NuoI [Candidatus Annandia pinicola]|uniref:NADH-quinone oxidoreductase subunit NuoI n=1 Tax=Candidatus Annandia pinicola TaxID=1345117 RepID=UPI001D014BB8|nr:NADH-quinone oxidoreductase subunit NuoI [Candidatus Annandia pinicola]UDG80306.1 NADH-quinone oxidoreductase subunit I [Candidatus Annandia pinicola]
MIFKKIILFFFTQLRSIWKVGLKSFEKRETILYPEKKVYIYPRYRGRIILTKDPDGNERCVACNLCAVSCPVGCISLKKKEKKKRWYAEFFRINFSRCIFCGMCEEACPTQAIQLIDDFELSDYKRKDLIYEKKDLLISGTGKYPNYNFYKLSGISFNNKNNKRKNNKIIDIKKLMP